MTRDEHGRTPRSVGEVGRYLTEREVYSRFGISRATWRRWMAAGYAPRPVHLGPRTVRWLRQEIEAFERRAEEDRGGGGAA